MNKRGRTQQRRQNVRQVKRNMLSVAVRRAIYERMTGRRQRLVRASDEP